MNRKKIFRVLPMPHTPLANEASVDTLNAAFVDRAEDADVFVTRRLREFSDEILAMNRLTIVWTHEPGFAALNKLIVRNHRGLADVHVFNVFNHNVYTDNYFYAHSRPLQPLSMASFDHARFERRSVAVFAMHATRPLILDGKDYSLYTYRTEMALGLHRLGICEIHGKHWPEGVAVGESRGDQQHDIKRAELGKHPFSLCCENTAFDFYVTEKIWQAIEGNALPIYYPTQAFADAFPPGSFLDLSDPKLGSPEAVADKIRSMTAAEYVERMNLCIEAYNYAAKNKFRTAARDRAVRILANLVRTA